MSSVIGITGGIASGKSTITKYLKSLGYKIIDADDITHKLYKKGARGYNMIIQEFGDSLDDNGAINRNKLREIILNNKDSLKKLNDIMHPIIKDEIIKEINESNGIIFLDVPLLFEAHFDDLCDKTVLIYVPYNIQLERLMKRDNINEKLAKKKIDIQMKLDDKKELSDYVIDNSLDIDKTLSYIDNMLEELKR